MNKQKFSLNKKIVVICFVFIMIFSVASVIAEPYGSSFSEISSERAPADSPANHSAIAGNVTELDVTGFSTTRAWQGYFGNITGTIQLADSNDNQMYNWTLADPRGQIYASESDTISWDNVHCFNFTANDDSLPSDCSNPGGSCKYGLSLDELETEYGIDTGDVDGVDETFISESGQEFYVGSLQFSSSECPRTNLFDSSGGATANYEEVLLYEPVEGSGISGEGYPIFTSIIEGGSVDGFDGRDHDFEMLVLEDGHGTDTATTTYYFYVELH